MGHHESIFLVTEGKKTDRWYYDNLIAQSSELSEKGVLTYTVASLTKGIDGVGEGKSGVLAVFRELRASKQLVQHNSSGKKSMVFAVDLDFDHLCGGRSNSNHLIYTKFPDIEAHLLADCDLVDVVANVASLPRSDADFIVDKLGDWIRWTADNQIDWMAMCCAARRSKIANCPSPGTEQKTERKVPLGVPLSGHREAIRESMRNRVPATAWASFEAHENALKKALESLVEREPRRLLKGKEMVRYLRYVITDEAEQVLGEPIAISSDVVLGVAKANARFDSAWCKSVQSKILATV